MAECFQIFPVGLIKKQEKDTIIQIHQGYEKALLGLGQFSHIIVLYWFHGNDTPEKRSTLQVHPRGNRSNPLTGVFATRSPLRPNLLGLTTCKILSIHEDMIRIDKIDAFAGTPVIDIKPCISPTDLGLNARIPRWAKS